MKSNYPSIVAVALLAAATLVSLVLRSDPVRASPDCATPPPSLGVELNADRTAVVVTWEEPTDCTPDEYAIYRRLLDSSERMRRFATVDGSTLSYTDAAVEAGKTYRYRVRSNNKGPRSGSKEVTLPAAQAQARTVQTQAAAQTTTTYVSNLGQLDHDSSTMAGSSRQYAQGFTTGRNSRGYVLAEVVINVRSASTATLDFGVYTSATDSSNLRIPGTEVAGLSGTVASTGEQSFTPESAITLEASKTYFIVLKTTSGEADIQRTGSDNIDAGAAAGWNIADTSRLSSDGGTSWVESSLAVEIAIKGSLAPNNDATLSALELEDSGDNTLTPTPEFASGTTTYSVALPNSENEITLTPTATDTTATIEYLDGSGNTIEDADGGDPGQQVTLDVGDNQINVRVTAANGTATATYALTVTRLSTASSTLVSNTAQDVSSFSTDTAFGQQFTTGSVAHGYRLSGVLIAPGSSHTDILVRVVPMEGLTTLPSLASVSTTPGVITLTTPSPITANALNTFTAPAGTTLTADTTYYVVVSKSDGTAGLSASIALTRSTSEDTGGAIGWTIGDSGLDWDSASNSWTSSLSNLRLQISGAPMASNDATLSGLALTDSSDGSAITLTPAFDSGTTRYTATVADGVSTITVSPTTSHPGATVVYSDAASTDADTRKEGRQVALSPGLNTITLDVTAHDLDTTATYTVVVTRGTSNDATLSGLALTNTDDESAIALTPAFNAGTTNYAASVPDDVDEITVTATANAATASIGYGSADADGMELGHQVALASGDNTVTVIVTAEDQATTQTYSVVVTRTESTDATLSSLELEADDLIAQNPAFASDATEYVVFVANGEDQITVTPTTNHTGATIAYLDDSGAAITDADSAEGHQVSLSAGDNTINVRVTAEDQVTTETYSVVVTRVAASSTLVSNTGQSSGSHLLHKLIAQAFSTGQVRHGYLLSGVAVLPGDHDSDILVRIVPVAEETDAPDLSDPTKIITLTNPATVDGTRLNTFRAPTGTVLAKGTTYFVVVSDGDGTGPPPGILLLRSSTADDAGGATGWSISNESYDNSSDAQGDWSRRLTTYGIKVLGTPLASPVATLSDLELHDSGTDSEVVLTPSFDIATRTYTASVVASVGEVTVTPTTSYPEATVRYLDAGDATILDADTQLEGQQVALSQGDNTIGVEVTATDLTNKETYTVTVTRPVSTDATLSNLVLADSSDGSAITLDQAFDAAVTSYSVFVDHSIVEVTVTPTRGHSQATMEFLDANEMALADADLLAEGLQVLLSAGENTIKVRVTAEDGMTISTYTIVVTHGSSNDATLKSLDLTRTYDNSTVELTPAFEAATTGYTAAVMNHVLEITVTAITSDPHAAVEYLDGNGDTLTDEDTRVEGFQVALEEGQNTIKVQVTAEDTVAVETYTFVVTRATNTEARLSNLELVASTADSVPLDPRFASWIMRYIATVPNAVDEVTVAATATHGATIEYLDASNTEITDAADMTDGLQVSLTAGAQTTIKVRVTAQDGNATETYTIVVTRSAVVSTFVSNTGQASASGSTLVDRTWYSAQQFTTGTTDGGYLLTGASIDFLSSHRPAPAIGVYENKTQGGTDVPGRKVASLSGDISSGVESLAFEEPPFLAASTPYWLVIKTTSGTLSVRRTNSTELDSGAATGWDIADTSLHSRNAGSSWDSALPRKIAITGVAISDPRLSNLGMKSDGTAITLIPEFATGRTSYRAYVENSVTEITVTPAKSNSAATVEYLDAGYRSITDASSSDQGHQVALNDGDTVIRVRVTSEGGTATRTYSVFLTRLPAASSILVSNSGQSGQSTTQGRRAQGFFTGAAPEGYALESVAVATGSADSDILVRIVPTDLQYRLPTDQAISLTTPDTISATGLTTFEAPTDTVLQPGKQYAVYITDAAGSSNPPGALGVTTSKSDDAGAARGWSIRDVGLHRTVWADNVERWSTDSTHVLQLEVRGTRIASADARLSHLTVTTGSDGSVVELRPLFEPTVTGYQASLPHTNRQATVSLTAAAVHPGARVEYPDGRDVTLGDGDTTITVQVTAEDTETTRTYTIVIAHGESTDATLSDLVLHNTSDSSVITLSPAFESDTTSYTASVASDVGEITVTASTSDTHAGVQYLDGRNVVIADSNDLEDGYQRSLTVGANTIELLVDAEDGKTTRTYTIVVTRAASTDATLSGLALIDYDGDVVSLTPNFTSDSADYSAFVAHDVDELTVTPTTNHPGATIEYLDEHGAAIADADGTEDDHQVSLGVGKNTIQVRVTAEDGGTTATYTILATRLPAPSVLISNTGQPSGTLFSSDINAQYFTTGPVAGGYRLSGVTFKPGSSSTDILVRIVPGTSDNVPILDRPAETVTLSAPATINGNQLTTFTAPHEVTLEADTTYHVVISDAAGTAGPPGMLTLTDSTAHDPGGAFGWSIGNQSLSRASSSDDWTNSLSIVEIQVTGTAIAGTDATLSALALSDSGTSSTIPLSPAFVPGHTSYAASVETDVAVITVAPTATDDDATIEYLDGSGAELVDADGVKDGHQVQLSEGNNSLAVRVTAEDLAATELYTLGVTRAYAPNLLVNPTSLTVGESASGDFTVRLTTRPAGTVTVTVVSDDPDAATVSPPSLSFTTSDWNRERRVTVRGADDADGQNEAVTVSLTASGGGYNGKTGSVSVAVTDDESGLVVQPTSLAVGEAGSNDFTVKLLSQPSGTVTVTVRSDDTGAATVSDPSLTFTTSTWDDPQTVTVSGVDDVDGDDEAVRVELTASGGGYTAHSAAVAVNVTDDDLPIVSVSFEESDYTVREGQSVTIKAILSAPPERDIEIPLRTTYFEGASSDDHADVPASVTFTANQTEQAFTLRAQDDVDSDEGEIVEFAFGDLPERVQAGTHALATVLMKHPRRTVFSIAFAGSTGPTPSDVDFEWAVKHDIEQLHEQNDWATGMWSDDTTIWILDNAPGAGDAIYAYDLESGERREESEFELDEANQAPRGVWSDSETIWISDSGRDLLFAYNLVNGERLADSDVEFAPRNRDARGIWSDGETLWVLDDRSEALFAYRLASGVLLGAYELDEANDQPHGIWSDGTTVWVSNHDPKRLLAYVLPVAPDEPVADAEPVALERTAELDFTEVSGAGNNSPRGIWSDGAVMYVVDANDDRVYSYNMPDAIDARLISLELSGVDFGEFSPLHHHYVSETIPHGNIATLAATPAQEGAGVEIEPPDHDGDPSNGHHLRLLPGLEITITVTSEDGSRERVYTLRLGEEEETGPAADCLRGAVNVGFSLVVYEGGSVEDLVACAEGRHVTALYVLDDGAWVSYIVGAPQIVNARFQALFADGVPASTPLVVKSDGPATPAPKTPPVVEPFAACLRGGIAEGFSLVLYEGGSVEDLDACAELLGVTAIYVLRGGDWVSYILAAPGFVNRRFQELFPDGVPTATPLTVRAEGL